MNEYLAEYLAEYLPAIIGAAAGVFTAVCSLVVYLVDSHKKSVRIKELEKSIEEAKSRETYTMCPHCGKHIPMSDLHFYLPSGLQDDNLDGNPDY